MNDLTGGLEILDGVDTEFIRKLISEIELANASLPGGENISYLDVFNGTNPLSNTKFKELVEEQIPGDIWYRFHQTHIKYVSNIWYSRETGELIRENEETLAELYVKQLAYIFLRIFYYRKGNKNLGNLIHDKIEPEIQKQIDVKYNEEVKFTTQKRGSKALLEKKISQRVVSSLSPLPEYAKLESLWGTNINHDQQNTDVENVI